jgi:ParB family transcriptional regulator, chromosome partitioning protein
MQSSSSSPGVEERLRRIPIDRLHAHPANANRMDPEAFEKLRENIRREGEYPPVIVRSHPDIRGHFQIIDGHNRTEVGREDGATHVTCYVWECDDRTALVLLATLNRLEGQDIPVKRAELLAELTSQVSAEDLALLLPEDESVIQDTLKLLDLDVDALLADLEKAAAPSPTVLRGVTFALTVDEEELVERVIEAVKADMSGRNRRGAALVAVCRVYLEATDA